MTNAAIHFEPEAYAVSGPKIMGRQAAGNAFLRAAVAGLAGQPVYAYTPTRSSAEVFSKMVTQIDPKAAPRWVPSDRLEALSHIGNLYLPGPELGSAARQRLRLGTTAYSITGITHTTASHVAMDSIAGMLVDPVMPWDALICTSNAVVDTVRTVLEAQADYARWRFGATLMPALPQLPVIPLGVHCADYDFSDEERIEARRHLGLAEDEVVALFVGRLSFHAKAHPHAMYAALQVAATRNGKKLVLLQCGWFANDGIAQAFADGAQQFCPDVRSIFSNGKDAEERRRSWAAADLFISLSDNIQETFGLTPIEALAAGLPVLVTDWDGYKDTVRDGVDGFRVPTWMPVSGIGEGMARAYEAGSITYDHYCGYTCLTVSVDLQVLTEKLTALVGDPDLRKRMGAAGRQRAREIYEWSVVFRQYQSLWSELALMRSAAATDPSALARLQAAPRATPGRLDPFRTFATYPTHCAGLETVVELMGDANTAKYAALSKHALFDFAPALLPAPVVVEALFIALADGALPARALAERCARPVGELLIGLAVLAKMGLVRLHESAARAVE